MSWPVISDDHNIQADYEAMRAQGQSHLLAEMLALRSPPMSNTDRELLAGAVDKPLGPSWIDASYRQHAAQAGVSTTGKIYVSGLARYPGDPRAWIGSRGEIKDICQAEGWGARGSVDIAPAERKEVPVCGPLADDIVDNAVADIIDSHPEPKGVDVTECREAVRQQLSRKT